MNKNENFIRVIENALPDELCDQIIDIFDNSPNVKQGQTGGGIDTNKKNSMDV
jgi:hypothetical protein